MSVRIPLLVFTLSVGIALAQDVFRPDSDLPRVILTRTFEHGSSESLTLRCTKDLKGKQEFFCEVLRFRNGVEVNTIGLYSKQTKAILGSFFQIFPAEDKRATNGEAPSDPLLVWDVSYNHQTAKGYVLRSQKERNEKIMQAVLSLEGALASQFYR